ncbi:MAG: hypothetical protein AMJ65_14065, partial [Phycisphaerae bacterium SG8_4]
MKTKALITSIVLSLTVVVLIGYFVAGCSSLKDVAVRRVEDQRVADAKAHDAATKVEPELVVTNQTEEPKDKSNIQNGLSEQEVAKNADDRPVEVLSQTDSSSIPHGEEITYPRNWRELIQQSYRQPDEMVRAPGDGTMGGGIGDYDKTVTYDWSGKVQPRGPRAQSSSERSNRLPGLSRVGGSPGSAFDRRMPVELVNVSVD